MNTKTAICAALLLPTMAMAQAYNPATGQRYDAYGRPLASVEDLCREGQMAGGPVTQKCAMYGYYFNGKGERLIGYDFTRWGYNIVNRGVTETEAQRLNDDPAYRAKYIKQHGYEQYQSKGRDDAGQCAAEAEFAYKIGQESLRGTTVESARDAIGRPDRTTTNIDQYNIQAEAYNRKIMIINRSYLLLADGRSPNQVRDAALQACNVNTPTLPSR